MVYSKKDPIPGEWETDEHGKRFRRVGNCIEYEPTITVAGGLEIPQSQFAEYTKRQQVAEECRRLAAIEAYKNSSGPKACPFTNSINNTCKRENCKIFTNEKCALAAIADVSGVEVEETPAKDKKKCPFSAYGHCSECALYNHGCALVRLAAATNKE